MKIRICNYYFVIGTKTYWFVKYEDAVQNFVSYTGIADPKVYDKVIRHLLKEYEFNPEC